MRKDRSESLFTKNFNFSYKGRERISMTALVCFFSIVKFWKLTDKEKMCLMGIRSLSTLKKYKVTDKVVLSKIQLESVSYILRIYKALGILFSASQSAQNDWMKKSNTRFDGQSAMEFIMSGDMSIERTICVVQYLKGRLQ